MNKRLGFFSSFWQQQLLQKLPGCMENFSHYQSTQKIIIALQFIARRQLGIIKQPQTFKVKDVVLSRLLICTDVAR